MRPRQPPPRVWLMTDERMGVSLWSALASLPTGAGIVFRHYRTPAVERRLLFDRVRAIARRRGLILVLADETLRAVAWRADGRHGDTHGRRSRRQLRTAPAHDARELVASRRAGVDIVFLSPVFSTRSHPGYRTLGPVRFGLLAQAARRQAGVGRIIALGGMSKRRYARLAALGADGWAAIDAWSF